MKQNLEQMSSEIRLMPGFLGIACGTGSVPSERLNNLGTSMLKTGTLRSLMGQEPEGSAVWSRVLWVPPAG